MSKTAGANPRSHWKTGVISVLLYVQENTIISRAQGVTPVIANTVPDPHAWNIFSQQKCVKALCELNEIKEKFIYLPGIKMVGYHLPSGR